MEYAAAPGRNSFKSSKKDKILTYPTSDILCQIEAPIPTNQRVHYSIASEAVDKIEKTAQ